MPVLSADSFLPPKTLVYTESKVGKTRMIGRLAKTRKLVMVDNEGSAKTLLDPLNLDPKYLPNLNVLSMPDSKNFPISSVMMRKILGMPVNTVFNFCHAHTNHNCPKCKLAGKPFSPFSVQKDVIDVNGILVFETLSQMTSSFIEYIRRDAKNPYDTNLANLAWENEASIKKFNDGEKLDWDQWGELGNLCFEILKAIQAAPFEIIVSTHPVMAKYEDGTSKVTPLMGTDKFTTKVAGHFDNVIYGYISMGKRKWISEPDLSGAVVGCRTPMDISKLKEEVNYSLLEPLHPPRKV